MNSQQNLDQHIGIGSEEQTKFDPNAGLVQFSYVSKWMVRPTLSAYSLTFDPPQVFVGYFQKSNVGGLTNLS
jgi:hypothetical protein